MGFNPFYGANMSTKSQVCSYVRTYYSRDTAQQLNSIPNFESKILNLMKEKPDMRLHSAISIRFLSS